MEFQAKWIRTSEETGGVCPVFRKGWKTERKVERATLYLTALGGTFEWTTSWKVCAGAWVDGL